jgi:hypothetical protein
MSARTAIFLATCGLLHVVPSVSVGQGYMGRTDNPNGPTVSPYMNLLQNNSIFNQAPTYNPLVKPIIDQQSALNRQASSINRLSQQINSGGGGGGGGAGGMRGSTGHTSYFMNYSHFYPRSR